MTRKQCLMALMVTAFPAIAFAQTGSNGLSCRGLTGSAAAQCIQGVGPGRAETEAAGSDDASVGLSDSIRNFFNGQSDASDRDSISTSLNCRGLIGAAVAQCLQGVGPGVPRTIEEKPVATKTATQTANQTTHQDVKAPDSGQSARSVGDAAGDVVSSVRNFFSGLSWDPGSSSGTGSSESSGTSLNCQGLFGTAMARCLQGIPPAPGGAPR